MAPTWARNGMWALLVLVVGGSLAYALLVGKPRPEPQPPVPTLAPRVQVAIASPQELSLSVQTQGTVYPRREIQLVSQVGGRVESVSARFDRGGFFAAGEQLLKIEDVDYQFDIARARSQVAAARQRVAEEQGRSRQARREWRDLGSEEANELFLRKPQVAAAQAALEAAEADLDAAQLDLERTTIKAPFAGRISEKHVDLGQYVAPGTAIATVYDTEVAQVRLPLTGRQVALLDLPLSYDQQSQVAGSGAPVVLRASFANREWQWHGRIVRTDASIDINSRVVYAVAEVVQPFARDPDSERPPLAPGLFVHARISGRAMQAVTELPRSALRDDDTVMVVDDGQRARARPVTVLQSRPGQVWVQGLEPGEQVIVREPLRITAGMAVTVEQAGELAAGGAAETL